jgi:hypothetical protein
VTEVALALLVIPVLLIADPPRLQSIIDRARQLIYWLSE